MDRHIIAAAIERAMGKDMEYGKDDCSLWPCDVILAESKIDLAKPLRGKYRTAAGAYRVMKRFSGGGLVETAIKLATINALKRAEFPWRGDLVGVVGDANGPALALFWNNHWVGRTSRGITALPPGAAVIAWELPPCRR